MYRIPTRPGLAWLCGLTGCLLLLAPLLDAQESYGNNAAPVAAVVLGVDIRTSNPGEMAYVINQMLMLNYAKTHNLQATNAEIEQFMAGKQKADVRVREEVEARLGEIQKALQSETLRGPDREQLEGELQFLQQMQQAARDADKQAGGSGPTAAETQMARAIIGQWKVNKALYGQYGGRVIHQQGGAEPLDAYYQYFKTAQKAGELKFVNKDLEAVFWSYFSSDSKHKFYPENEKDQAINTPWWQMEPPSGK